MIALGENSTLFNFIPLISHFKYAHYHTSNTVLLIVSIEKGEIVAC